MSAGVGHRQATHRQAIMMSSTSRCQISVPRARASRMLRACSVHIDVTLPRTRQAGQEKSLHLSRLHLRRSTWTPHLRTHDTPSSRRQFAELFMLACLVATTEAFMQQPALRSSSKLSMSKLAASPKMSLELNSVEQMTQTLAGVVAVDGGTLGLDVNFGGFLAIILGLFIPVVFLVTLYIQSEAQGTAVSFRQPDSIGGTLYEDE